MSVGHTRLHKIVEREFRQLAERAPDPPRRGKFKARRINLETFGRAWERRRGLAVRLAGVLLRDDDSKLEARVCAGDEATSTYAGGVELLQREAAHLRKISRMLDTAAGRLSVVLERCEQRVGSSGVP